MTPNSYAPMTAWLDHAWVTRYLDGLLSDEETAWFEAYVLDKPQLLSAIEADTRLREALSAEPLAQQPLAAQSPAQESRSARQPWFAMAASLVVGIGVALVGIRLKTPDESAVDLVANPTRIAYDTMRGGGTQRSVEPGDSNSPYLILQVTVPYGAADIHLLIDESAPLTLTATKDGIATAIVQRRVFAHTPKALIEYKIDGSVQRQTLDMQEGTKPAGGENN